MTNHLQRGDVVLVRFPNADLLTYKLRPALIVQSDLIVSEYGDWLVAMITSRLERRSNTTLEIQAASRAGREMGLRTDSLVVLHRIATIPDDAIHSKIGRCPRMNDVAEALRRVFDL